MESYTYHRICITGGLELEELLELEFQVQPNQHGTAYIKGFLKADSKEIGEESLQHHRIKLYLLQKDGTMPQMPFFSGYIKTAEKSIQDCRPVITFTLLSGTTELDRAVKSASFQDISWSYETILKRTIKDTPHADGIFTKGRDTYPEKPLIQYRETNWDFILRLASHLQTVVYPEVSQSHGKFYFGMPNPVQTVTFAEVPYSIGISENYYKLGGASSGFAKKEFQYVKVQSYKDYAIGTNATFEQVTYRICEKKGKLVENHLVFTYTLGREPLTALKRRTNPLFAGMSLLGNVLSVEGETIKIHLDIDKEQAESSAYPYEWVPDTGSVMYCMPQEGTKVSLYFSNEEESSAMAVNCVRTNGATCAKTSQTEDRYLATEHGKELFLKPDSIGLDMEETGQFLTMQDDIGIHFDSSKKISIVAKKQVKCIGKQVVIQTPTEMNLGKF